MFYCSRPIKTYKTSFPIIFHSRLPSVQGYSQTHFPLVFSPPFNQGHSKQSYSCIFFLVHYDLYSQTFLKNITNPDIYITDLLLKGLVAIQEDHTEPGGAPESPFFFLEIASH